MNMPTVTVIIENSQDHDPKCPGCSVCSDNAEYSNEQEIDITCPASTQNPTLSDAYKEMAIQKHSYGPTDNPDKRCGNCGYFNQTDMMRECIDLDDDDVGYCQLHSFVCSAAKVCDSWMKGGPIKDYIMSDDNATEEMLGKRFI